MANVARAGFDYFPHDINMHTDESLLMAWQIYGNYCVPFTVYNLILERVYERNGYYIVWSASEALKICRDTGLSLNDVSSALDALVESGAFDSDIFNSRNILTSKGIQKRFLKMSERRSNKIIEPSLSLCETVCKSVGSTHVQPNVQKTAITNNVAEMVKDAAVITNTTGAIANTAAVIPQSKVKESKVKTPLISPHENVAKMGKGKTGQDVAFEAFWTAYPKKRNKQRALKVWTSLKPGSDLQAKILRSLDTAKESKDWKKNGGQYIPHPSTWLNAGGWDDEYEDEGAVKEYGWSESRTHHVEAGS